MEPENPSFEIAKAYAEGAGKESANKFFEFLGGLVPFWGMKKKAVDVYVREIEQSNLSPKAKMMAIANAKKSFRELKNQSAIIDIAYAALGEGKNIDNDPQKNVDSELINRLIDSGKFVSDKELRLLWGIVLAGEFEDPGSTPKNIVRILSELSKEYATAFSTLCSLQVGILADSGNDIYYLGQEIMAFLPSSYLQEMKINLDTIQELEQLGLINFLGTGPYGCPISNKCYPYIHIVCDSHVITAINTINEFPIGQIMLTKAGQCISRFVPARYNQQHMESIKKYLMEEASMKFSPTPTIRITGTRRVGIHMEYRFERQSITPPQTPEQ